MWANRGPAGCAACSSGQSRLSRDLAKRANGLGQSALPVGSVLRVRQPLLAGHGRLPCRRLALVPSEARRGHGRQERFLVSAESSKGRSPPDSVSTKALSQGRGADPSSNGTGEGKKDLQKARMYLMRSDGLTCTREIVEDSQLRLSFPSTQQQLLVWKDQPRTVLVLKKLGDDLMPHLARTCKYLKSEGISAIVEPHDRERLLQVQRRPGDYDHVQTFNDTAELPEVVDFIVCLGGDGVILHAASLFRTVPVPPVISFHLGSLGFLTNHSFLDYKKVLHGVIHGEKRLEACSFPMSPTDMITSFEDSPQGPVGVYVTLRMRLVCDIYRNGKRMPGGRFEVMNEIVVDRGSNPFLTKIECYEKGALFTKVQADGVLLATPTGSTAYSVAAGGSMVHPNISAILFTPVCPHSLSFRPIVMPDYAEIELRIPQDARCTAWVCFDGKARQELMRGDSIIIKMSQHPVPTINAEDQTTDWFNSLERCLSWNERAEQGAMEMESDLSLDLSTLSVSESLDMDWDLESAAEKAVVDPLEKTQ